MSVYVDRSRFPFKGHLMCHMLADTEKELKAMATVIQPRGRYQLHASTPHFDLTPWEREAAVRAGAVEIDRRQTVAIIKAIRDAPEKFFGKSAPSTQQQFDF